MKKIRDIQLKKITDQQQKLSRLLNNIGVLEIQKQSTSNIQMACQKYTTQIQAHVRTYSSVYV